MSFGLLDASSWPERSFAALTPEARRRLLELGAPLLRTEAEGRLALAERKIKTFEHKYGTGFVELEHKGLPENADIEMHKDFVEWSGWQRTLEETRQVIASLQPIVETHLAQENRPPSEETTPEAILTAIRSRLS